MQKQEFEKQVQQKMEDFSITPSAPVWQKVETQIRHKKDRRRVAYWALPLLLVGGGLFWWLHTPQENVRTVAGETSPVVTTTPKQEKNDQHTNITTSLPGQKEETVSATTKHTETLPPALQEQPMPAASTPTTRSLFNKQTSGSTTLGDQTEGFKRTIANSRHGVKNKKAQSATIKSIDERSDLLPREDGSAPVVTAPATTTPSVDAPATPNQVNTRSIVEAGQPDTSLAPPQPEATKKDSAHAEPAKTTPLQKAAKAEWKWTAQVRVGFSNMINGMFDKSPFIPVLAFAPAPINAAAPVDPLPPTETSAGASFSVGAGVKRRLGDRTWIATGIDYSYYSTRNVIGYKVPRDTVLYEPGRALILEQFYRSGDRNQYINQFHFIEIPVSIEFELGKKLPLSLQGGVSMSYLVHTNMLNYNKRSSIYYRDNSTVNNTQLHLFTSVQYQLMKKSKYSVQAGPFGRIAATELMNDGGNRRLYSAGLKAMMVF